MIMMNRGGFPGGGDRAATTAPATWSVTSGADWSSGPVRRGFIIALGPSRTATFWHSPPSRDGAPAHWLRSDPFSLSAAGRAWPNVHWLFQLAAFAIYAAAGSPGW